jgi:alkylation response protein AidB-like acyl-CoA dehydrogenase
MAKLAQTAGLTEIQQEILATVRTFVDKEILPHANALEHADTYPQDIVDGMKEMGLFGLTIPEEFGGLGESLLTYALVVEQIARGWMSVSGVINTHFIVAHMITQHGTQEQKERYLPRMAAGEVRGSFSMSEPDLGSDVAAISTKAVADGDEFVIDGAKMWLTNGGTSNLTAVLVRTDEGAERAHQNLTCFLVDKPEGYGRGVDGGDREGVGHTTLYGPAVRTAAQRASPSSETTQLYRWITPNEVLPGYVVDLNGSGVSVNNGALEVS